ncbi:hypothetical protein BDB01DRAFT_840897 [Pilobolus umbonatus]|nr:hypothetical protein BDB01DRAFT_840897 [Pilobolus umbonatus]
MSSFHPTVPAQPEKFAIVLSGIGPEAAALTEQLLIKNDNDFHCFFNKKKFHNHLVHQILASYSLGASKERIQEIFNDHASYQLPLTPQKEAITMDNYKKYLNDVDAYSGFLTFFKAEIKSHGMIETIRRWVWSGDFMCRTVGGVFHPLIHIGYALEFNLPGIAAEGLAMAACTDNYLNSFIPLQPEISPIIMSAGAQSYVENAASSTREYITHLSDRLSAQVLSPFASSSDKKKSVDSQPIVEDNTTFRDLPDYLKQYELFKILLQLKEDTAFNNVFSFDTPIKFRAVISDKKASKRIRHYVESWHIEENTKDVQKKFKELYILSLILLGAGGIRNDHPGDFKLDFFFIHCLTSASFIHHFLNKITPSESVILLKAHFSSVLMFYLTQGRPHLNIDGLLNYEPSSTTASNAWLGVFDKSIQCQESHRVKTVRACALGQILYGQHDDQHLNKAWLKVAQMAIDESKDYNFSGVGFDESWVKTEK